MICIATETVENVRKVLKKFKILKILCLKFTRNIELSLLVQRCNGTTAGLGYLEVNMICPCNLPIGRWTSVRTVDPHGANGSNPLLTLTLTTITSMQIQNKQASTPHHVHSTIQPSSKIIVCKIYLCQYQPVKIIKLSGHIAGNYTGPYNIPICFDATNDGLMTGFNIDYLLLPC